MKRKREREHKSASKQASQIQPTSFFSRLMDDHINHLLTFLDQSSLNSFGLTEKRFQKIVKSYQLGKVYLGPKISNLIDELGILIDKVDIFRYLPNENYQSLYRLLISFQKWLYYIELVEFKNNPSRLSDCFFVHLEDTININLSKLGNHPVATYVAEVKLKLPKRSAPFPLQKEVSPHHKPPSKTVNKPNIQQQLSKFGINDLIPSSTQILNELLSRFTRDQLLCYRKWILQALTPLISFYKTNVDSDKLNELNSVIRNKEGHKFFMKRWGKKLIEFLCHSPEDFQKLFINKIHNDLSDMGKLMIAPHGGDILDVIIDNELYKKPEKIKFLEEMLIQPDRREKERTYSVLCYYSYSHPRLLKNLLDSFQKRIDADDFGKSKKKEQMNDLQFYANEIKLLTEGALDIGWSFNEIKSFVHNEKKITEWLLQIPEIVSYWSPDTVEEFYKSDKKKADINSVFKTLSKCPHRYLLFKKFRTLKELLALQQAELSKDFSILMALCKPDSDNLCYWILDTQFTTKSVISYMQNTASIQLLYQRENVNEFMKLSPNHHPQYFNEKVLKLFQGDPEKPSDRSLEAKLVLLLSQNASLLKYANEHKLNIESISKLDPTNKLKIYKLLLMLNYLIEDKFDSLKFLSPTFLIELMAKIGVPHFNNILKQPPVILNLLLYSAPQKSRSVDEISSFIISGLIPLLLTFKTAQFSDKERNNSLALISSVTLWCPSIFEHLSIRLINELCYEQIPHIEKLNCLALIARCGEELFLKIMGEWPQSAAKNSPGDLDEESRLKSFLMEWYTKPWIMELFDSSLSLDFFKREKILKVLPLDFLSHLYDVPPVNQQNMLYFLFDHIDIHEGISQMIKLDKYYPFDPARHGVYYPQLLSLCMELSPNYHLMLGLINRYGIDHVIALTPSEKELLQKFFALHKYNAKSILNFHFTIQSLVEKFPKFPDFLSEINKRVLWLKSETDKVESGTITETKNMETENDSSDQNAEDQKENKEESSVVSMEM